VSPKIRVNYKKEPNPCIKSDPLPYNLDILEGNIEDLDQLEFDQMLK
jgi:hypothetical protein